MEKLKSVGQESLKILDVIEILKTALTVNLFII